MDTAVIVGSVILGSCLVLAAIIVAFGERRGASPVGRYKFFQAGDGGGVLLDTRTGRLWERRTGEPAWSESANVPWMNRE